MSTITCRICFVTVTVTAFVGSNTIMAMSFSVRATPSNLVSYPELCCLRTQASTQASTLTHSGEPVREELRRQEALQLGGAPAHACWRPDKRHQATTGPYIDVQSPRGIEAWAHGGPIT